MLLNLFEGSVSRWEVITLKHQQYPLPLELLRAMDLLRRTWKLAIPNTGTNK